MTFEETRDNTTAIENLIIEGDAREDADSDGPADVRRVVFTGFSSVDPDDPDDPEHDELGDAETEYDIEYDDEPEDDGQPSEYEEWPPVGGGHFNDGMW